MEKKFQNLEKDQTWVYKMLDIAQPRINFEQPSVPLIYVIIEELCPFKNVS